MVKTEDILFVLGRNDLTHWATNGAITRGASKVQCHPYFKQNSKSAHGDMAVITLGKNQNMAKHLQDALRMTAWSHLFPICFHFRSTGRDNKGHQTGMFVGRQWRFGSASGQKRDPSLLGGKRQLEDKGRAVDRPESESRRNTRCFPVRLPQVR